MSINISDRENNSVIRHYLNMSMNEMRHLQIGIIIENHNIDTLMDFGCCQGLLIKKLSRSANMRLLVGVDIEESAVAQAIHNSYPELVQHTIQFSREKDQEVYIYRGDVTKKYQKMKEINVDLITLVEMIEHLVPEDIPKAMNNIFGYLKPKFCFISTPNKEFNDYFQFQEGQMRHWDHKFEWTRAEFKTFCDSVQDQFGYTYSIGGIGEHITETSKGQCTQYALFSRPEYSIPQDRNNYTVQNDDELEERVHHINKSWKSNKEKIMRETLYKSLFGGKEYITFDEAITFLKNEKIGECLMQNGEPITKELIFDTLQQNRNEFQWDDQIYQLRRTYESSVEQQVSQRYEQDFDFEQSFSESYQNELSVSTSLVDEPIRRGNRSFNE